MATLEFKVPKHHINIQKVEQNWKHPQESFYGSKLETSLYYYNYITTKSHFSFVLLPQNKTTQK